MIKQYQNILKLFISRGGFFAKRSALLWVWCNGDWRNSEVFADAIGRLA